MAGSISAARLATGLVATVGASVAASGAVKHAYGQGGSLPRTLEAQKPVFALAGAAVLAGVALREVDWIVMGGALAGGSLIGSAMAWKAPL